MNATKVDDVAPDTVDAAEAETLICGSDVFQQVQDALLAGQSDRLFNCGSAFPGVEIGPGLLTLLGAPPGRGKTALAMQALYDAIANEPDLRAVVASLEVSPATLVKRRLAMLLGVSFDQIRFNRLTAFQREDVANQHEFQQILERVDFVRQEACGLGDLEMLLKTRDEPGLLLLDYIQLFGSADINAQDRGMQTMATARRFCDAGWAVVAVSAVSRASYGKADIGGFRDTSSIEYSGTAAYILDEATEYGEDQPKPDIREMNLRCVKNRNGIPRSIPVFFNGPQMLFSSPEPVNPHEGDFDGFNDGDDVPESNELADILSRQPWKAK